MESSIAVFLMRWSACELLPTCSSMTRMRSRIERYVSASGNNRERHRTQTTAGVHAHIQRLESAHALHTFSAFWL